MIPQFETKHRKIHLSQTPASMHDAKTTTTERLDNERNQSWNGTVQRGATRCGNTCAIVDSHRSVPSSISMAASVAVIDFVHEPTVRSVDDESSKIKPDAVVYSDDESGEIRQHNVVCP